ncbi:carbohydrate ABC transporter permease [Demequina sp.]|uniref:carbohydrate ABC transporter permease n=1 Tax=Demequina sp. TaxID=2050685 RepID=UPI0025CE93C8|nr:carbohydrate ABC transporter permease [Demequina sp.]
MTATATAPAKKASSRRVKQGGLSEVRAGWFTKVLLGLLVVMWTVPTLGTIITSFRTLDDANTSGWWEVFYKPEYWSRLTFDNYIDAWNGAGASSANFGASFLNSLAIALPATFIPILIAAFAAYTFTFMEFKGREVLFILIVSLLVVPNFVAFIPLQNIYNNLEFVGFPKVWLAHIGFGMSLAIFILRNFMTTLPRSVIESAKIDGASHYGIFYRLILPMSVPALAAFAIFQFLWVWNDLMVALVFLGPGENEPVTVALTSLKGQLGQGWNLTTAGGILSMLVPVTVFLVLQRYFVRGLTAGAVKG